MQNFLDSGESQILFQYGGLLSLGQEVKQDHNNWHEEGREVYFGIHHTLPQSISLCWQISSWWMSSSADQAGPEAVGLRY